MHSLDDLASQLDRSEHVYARVHCVDGSQIEGTILDVVDNHVILVDEERLTHHRVIAHQLRSVDVRTPRRIREWLLAIGAIPVVTVLLVAFSRIPGVDPKRGDITIGFILVLAGLWGASRLPGLRQLLSAGLTRWDRVFDRSPREQA